MTVRTKKVVALMHRVLFISLGVGVIYFMFGFFFFSSEKLNTPASGASQGNLRFKPIWPKRHSLISTTCHFNINT